MKKKFLLGCVSIIALSLSMYYINNNLKSNENLSYLALDHIEALAQNESGNGDTDTCWTYYYWGSQDKYTCTPGEVKKCKLTAWVKPHDDYKHECLK